MNTVEKRCKESGCAVVSECTTRTQDTLPAMLNALREICEPAYMQVVSPGCGFSAFPSYAQEDEGSEWWRSDECACLWDSVADALNEHAPDGFHFGAHDDDGACLGFWRMAEECEAL